MSTEKTQCQCKVIETDINSVFQDRLCRNPARWIIKHPTGVKHVCTRHKNLYYGNPEKWNNPPVIEPIK